MRKFFVRSQSKECGCVGLDCVEFFGERFVVVYETEPFFTENTQIVRQVSLADLYEEGKKSGSDGFLVRFNKDIDWEAKKKMDEMLESIFSDFTKSEESDIQNQDEV